MQYEPLFTSTVTPRGQRVRATSLDSDSKVVTFVQDNPDMVSLFANADKLAAVAFGGTNLAESTRKTAGKPAPDGPIAGA